MARKHHKPEEIVAKLRQVEVLVGQGKPVADAPRPSWSGWVAAFINDHAALTFCPDHSMGLVKRRLGQLT